MFTISNSSSMDLKLIVSGSVTTILFSGLMLCIDLSGSFAASCSFHPDLTYTLLGGISIGFISFVRFCIHKAYFPIKAKNERKNVQKITDKFFPARDIYPEDSQHAFALLPSPLKKIVIDYYCPGYPELLFVSEKFGLSKQQIEQFLNQIPSYFELRSQEEFIEAIKCLEKISQKIPQKILHERKKNTDSLNHILYEWRKLSLDEKYQLFCWIANNKRKWCPRNKKGGYQETHCLSVAIMLLLPYKQEGEASFFKKSLIGDEKARDNREQLKKTYIRDGCLQTLAPVDELRLINSLLYATCSSSILFFRYLPKERLSRFSSYATYILSYRELTAVELFRRKIISWNKYCKHACILGWTSTLTTILKADPLVVKKILTLTDSQRRTLLHFVIAGAVMKAQRRHYDDIYYSYYAPYIKLIRQANYVEMVTLLIEGGSDPDSVDSGGTSSRALAARYNLQSIVDALNKKSLPDQKKKPQKQLIVSEGDMNCFQSHRTKPLLVAEVPKLKELEESLN